MKQVNRRHFLKRSLAGAVALAGMGVDPYWVQGAANTASVDQVTLGKSGIRLSRFAMGTGANGGGQSSDQTRLGQKKFDALIRHGLDRGINLWDMADLYGSHPYFGKVLKSLQRDNLVIVSKLWTAPQRWNDGENPQKDFDRIRREIGTEYIDILLMHCMTDSKWPEKKKKWMDFMSAQKEKGNIRAVGVSSHSLDALKTAVKTPWLDVVFARINHKGGRQYHMGAGSDEVALVLKDLRAAGKGVVGMKIYACGRLVETPQREESLRFVLNNDLVDAMTIGFLSEAEVDDHIARVDRILKS